MIKIIWPIIFLIFMCQILMAQNDTSRIAGLPFSSYLIKVDSLSDLELENDKFVFSEFAYTLDSNKHWEFIGLKIEFTAEGRITAEMKKPLIHSYKSKNDYQIIHSGEALLETFDIKELRDFRSFFSSFGTSYPWTPIYKGKYLIIEKCEGYIGSIRSFETKFKYFFVEKINTNYQPEFSQTNILAQNDMVEQINNTIELIIKEKFDTLILESINLRFDTLSVSYSPAPKHTFSDSTDIYVFYNENGIRKLYLCGTWYYFDNEKLLKTHFRCVSGDYMGLCGGTYSEYENYFVNNNFYTTVENNTFKDILSGHQCPCSDNIIINPRIIENIFLMYNEQK